jgi:hypothetical protein
VKISKRLRGALSQGTAGVPGGDHRVSAVGAGFYLSAVAVVIGRMVEIGLRAVAQFPLTWIVSRFGRPSRYENPEEPAASEPPPRRF